MYVDLFVVFSYYFFDIWRVHSDILYFIPDVDNFSLLFLFPFVSLLTVLLEIYLSIFSKSLLFIFLLFFCLHRMLFELFLIISH